MKRQRSIPRALSILLALSVSTCPRLAFGQVTLYEQVAAMVGGVLSDGRTITVADQFRLTRDSALERITWWGYYPSILPTPDTDDFTLRIFEDGGDKPGTLIATFTPGNDVGRVGGPFDFTYVFTLPAPLPLAANRVYWLSIVNVPSSDSWDWHVSSYDREYCSLHPVCMQRSFGDPVAGPWTPYYDNVSFRLEGTESAGCPEVTVELAIEPDAIHPRSGARWISAIIEPTSPHTPEDVEVASLLLESAKGQIAPDPTAPVTIGDADRDQVPDLTVKFRRVDVLTLLTATLTQLTITGRFTDQTCFRGTDEVRVVTSAGAIAAEARADGSELALNGIVPSPARGRSFGVSFTLPRPGPAKLTLFDVGGRVIASRDLGSLGQGRHVMSLGAERALSAGVYIIRLSHEGRTVSQRAILSQ